MPLFYFFFTYLFFYIYIAAALPGFSSPALDQESANAQEEKQTQAAFHRFTSLLFAFL